MIAQSEVYISVRQGSEHLVIEGGLALLRRLVTSLRDADCDPSPEIDLNKQECEVTNERQCASADR